MATLDVIIDNSPVRVDSVEGVGEHWTLETKRDQDKKRMTKRVSPPRVMHEVILRREISVGMDAAAFHEWYKKGDQRRVVVHVKSAPDNSNDEVPAFTVALENARPIRWFLEYADEPGSANDTAKDCLAVMPEDVTVSGPKAGATPG